MKRRRRTQEESGINVTPMLDVVFILLIFFIVTTSFVKEKGIEVSRPQKSEAPLKLEDRGPIVVRIDADSNIMIRGRIIPEDAVRPNLERERAESPGTPMVVAAHPDAETHALVAVLDSAKMVGIDDVSVTTTRN